MSDYMREKKRTAAENEMHEKQLMKALYKLIESYPNYEKPYLRKRDGDIVIPIRCCHETKSSSVQWLGNCFF